MVGLFRDNCAINLKLALTLYSEYPTTFLSAVLYIYSTLRERVDTSKARCVTNYQQGNRKAVKTHSCAKKRFLLNLKAKSACVTRWSSI